MKQYYRRKREMDDNGRAFIATAFFVAFVLLGIIVVGVSLGVLA